MVWRLLLGGLMAMHGLVHVLGFVVPWQLARPEGFPYTTTLLGGRVDVGDVGIRAIGVVWLVVAIAFVAAAAGLLVRQPWWWGAAVAAAGVSLVLSVLSLPEARVGLVVNVVLLALLLLVQPVRSLAA